MSPIAYASLNITTFDYSEFCSTLFYKIEPNCCWLPLQFGILSDKKRS